MRKIRDDGYAGNKRARDGITSFYGVHRYTQTGIIPKTSVGAPINDLYGPHLYFGEMSEESGSDGKQSEMR